MTKNQQTRPVEEGVDPSNERKVLDHLKKVDNDKKPTSPGAEVKKRVARNLRQVEQDDSAAKRNDAQRMKLDTPGVVTSLALAENLHSAGRY
jgi:hypothetical protein